MNIEQITGKEQEKNMENYQAWAEEVLEKVKEKMVWVSEKTRISSLTPPMRTVIMMTVPQKRKNGITMTV